MRVIINGDDFGLTRGVNEGIARAHAEGVLTSASLMAVGRAFDHAVQTAAGLPDLDVGVHLVLTDEAPLTDAAFAVGWPRGVFKDKGKLFGALMDQRGDLGVIADEWRAQIRRVVEAGISPSHLDSHQFVHLFPGMFSICQDLAAEFSIPHVRRRVMDPLSPAAGPRRLLQYAALKTCTCVMARAKRVAAEQEIPCVGFLRAGGKMTVHDLAEALEKHKECRAVEVMIHPGLADEETRALYGEWDYAWENDLSLATDPATRRALADAGAQLCRFSDVQGAFGY
ncbi:MAG: ChbG/HpnK family deacetylase [Deltaproteobacteria bacterium]|nr:ChbG/HpnK family deacetylase [Deltaproteobacteria bacterium]